MVEALSKIPPASDAWSSITGRLGRAARATWKIPLAAAIVTVFAVLGVLWVSFGAIPATTIYLSRFQFTFPEIKSSQTGERLYPNGRPFSINAVIDPVILTQVYDDLHLDQYGFKRDEFYRGFSIKPFAAAGAEISDRYNQLLQDRRLSFAERERIESQFKSEMEKASAGAAELSFMIRKNLPIPREVGQAIVSAVPLNWSRYAIERQGVLRIPGFSTSETVVQQGFESDAPLPVVLVRLSDADRRLSKRLRELRDIQGASTARDLVSGKSLADVAREADDLRLFHVNPLLSALGQYTFSAGADQGRQLIQRSLRDTELAEQNEVNAAAAIGQSIAQFVQASSTLKGFPNRRGSGVAESGDVTIPQLSEGFIDRVMRLARSGQEPDAEQVLLADLIKRQLEATQRANNLRAERESWNQLLSTVSDETRRVPIDDATQTQLIKKAAEAGNSLNTIWATLTRIEGDFAANRIDHSGSLYKAFLVPVDVIDRQPFLTDRTFFLPAGLGLLMLLAVWAGCIVAYLLSAGSRLSRSRD